ncbi:MAG TPA: T9SS type A sorting domain-containing protein, partial [Bacteroidia bacterium]|nr:T9SS type A sorting domain-containing protein [Bacteroidia bacterium]
VDDLKFEITAGISSNEISAKTFNCFPNPANDLLKLDLHDLKNIQSIRVINMQGQLVYSGPANALTNEIDISTFSPGVYLIQVKSESGISTQKFDKF